MQKISYEELQSLNVPWIDQIPVGEHAYEIIITELSEDNDFISFRDDSMFGSFGQNLNGNPAPKLGDRVFTFGHSDFKRGFATMSTLYEFETKEQQQKDFEEWSAENKRKCAESIAKQEETHKASFTIINQEVYNDWVEKNKDSYGRAVILFAERWATAMEEKISEKTTTEDFAKIAKEESYKADTDGITGFMYGGVVSFLVQTWKYGEHLKKLHNGEYNYEGDGVVNPAVLVIS